MKTVYNFQADSKLNPSLASRMQALANARASNGLASADGATHKTQRAKSLYDSGVSVFSKEYVQASFGESKK